MNPYINEDGELNVNDALKYIFKHWLIILLTGLLCAFFIIGVKGGLTNVISNREGKTESDDKDVNASEEKYQKALELYDDKEKSLSISVTKLRGEFDQLSAFLNDSILMKIDPYSVSECTEKYRIAIIAKDADEEAELIHTYLNEELTKGNYLLELADGIGTKEEYIYQVIHIDITDDENTSVENNTDNSYGESSDNGPTTEIVISPQSSVTTEAKYLFLTMSVIGPDEKLSSAILDAMVNEYGKIVENYSDKVVSTAISRTSRNYIDMGVQSEQKIYRQQATSLGDEIENLQITLDGLEKPLPEDYIDYQSVAENNNISLKAVIKYAIVGIIIGVFLTCIVLLFVYIAKDKLTSYEALSMRYKIKLLGSYDNKGKQDRHRTDKITALNIQSAYPDIVTKSIVISGSCTESALNNAAEGIIDNIPGINAKIFSDFIESTDGRAALASCDGVILIEEREVSKYSGIKKELEICVDLNKPVLGIIIV